MKILTNLIRYTLQVFLFISCISALVVLGLDLDLLLNGPEYLATVITNIANRLHQDEIVDQEELLRSLMEASQTLWVHIPMVMLVVMVTVLLMLNCLGCAGACLMSYSLLSGFTMFMFIIFVLFLSLAFWIFLNNMENSVMDSFVTERISQYNQSGSIFDIVIDTVQRDLQCCGFKSSSDWVDSFPASCCPSSCNAGDCRLVGECLSDNVYVSGCLDMIRVHLLQPDSLVGLIGVTFLVVVAVVGITTVLSLCLCVAARSLRGKKCSYSTALTSLDESVSGRSMELTSPRCFTDYKQ